MPSSIKDRFLGTAGASLSSHVSDSGHTWAPSAGLLTSAATLDGAGRLYNGVALASVMQSSWTPASPDYPIYFDIFKATNVQSCGVFGRLSGFNQAYLFWYDSNNLYIAKMSATGGATNLAQVQHIMGPGLTMRCRARMIGTALDIATQNTSTGIWTVVVATTDASYTTAGPCGVYFFGTESAGVGDMLTKFVALDGAASDMLIDPANVGGAGNATLTLRGYNTAWNQGANTPTFGISHGTDTATIVSQAVAATNLATVVVNTGLNAGTFALSDGTESSTATVASSAVVKVLLDDVRSSTPHISLFGLWTTTTIGASTAVVPSITPDYQGGYQDYSCQFVAFANQVTMLCNIPAGLTLYLSIDGAAATSLVGDGTDTTIVLYSIADGNQHLVRMTPPAGAKISDLTLYGSAPALTSVAVTQAWFASNIAGMQLPPVPSPISVHGTFAIDAVTSGVRSAIKAGGGGYNGGTYEFQTTGNAIGVLAIVVGTASQFQPIVNGVLPTLAQVPSQGDGTLTPGSKHWFPIAIAAPAGTNTVRVVNIGSNGTETIHYAVRARTQATTSNFLAAGGTALSLVSTANMVAGDWLLIGTEYGAEAVQVGSVTDATHISLIGGLSAAGLQSNHLTGSRVSRFSAPAATITPWNSKSYDKTMEEWGDSTTAGAQPTVIYTISQYDPTNQYAYRFTAPLPWDSIPLGVPGNHSFDLCIRVLGGTRTGNRYNNDGNLSLGDVPVYTPAPVDLIVIWIGINDCTLGVSASDFQHNIQALVTAAVDPSVLKPYNQGGRVLLFVPFSPLAFNTDPGVGGVLNSAGLHVGTSGWSTDPTNYGFWLAQAVTASGANDGYGNRVSVISVSGLMTTGATGAPGPDMHDDLHPNESGHTKIGAAIAAALGAIPAGTRVYAAVTYWS